MAHDIIMPALGMAQETGLIVSWSKAPGDPVAVGDTVMEVETDKSTMEVESEHAGYLGAILFAEGTDVPVGQVVARIVETLDQVDHTPPPAADVPSAKAETTSPPPPAPAAKKTSAPKTASRPSGQVLTGKVLASPKAKRLAAENGITINALRRAPGLSEPFHAADVETYLKKAPAISVDDNKTLSCVLSMAPAQALANMMEPEAGVPLSLADILAVLAGHLWRTHDLAGEDRKSVISLMQVHGGDLHQWELSAPDRLRFFNYAAHRHDGRNGAADISIVDLSQGAKPVTEHPDSGAALAITLSPYDGDGLAEVRLEYDDATLSPAAAHAFMNDFALLIEEPMRRLL